MADIDWRAVERGSEEFPALFDFYVTGEARDELTRILLDSKHPAYTKTRETALSELVRCYSAYKVAVGQRAFYLGATGRHRTMREAGLNAIETMFDRGIGPADVLFRLGQPGAMSWMGTPPSSVPWALLCSVKIIDMTERRSLSAKRSKANAKAAPAVTHSYSKPHERASEELRERLEAQFGKAAVDAVAKDDGELFVKVEARARELKRNPRLYLPGSTAEMVKWYMREHVQ